MTIPGCAASDRQLTTTITRVSYTSGQSRMLDTLLSYQYQPVEP